MRLIISFLFLSLIHAPTTWAQECDPTIYCEYPPPKSFELYSKGGLVYDQVWEIMRRCKIIKPVVEASWKRGYLEATTHPCIGLFPTTRTPEREKLFHWVGPILQVQWVFYAHADSNITINSIEDAKAVGRIGTYTHDSKAQWLRKNGFTNLVPVMDNVTNLKKLYDHRIDLMVGSPTTTDRWPETYGLDPKKLIPVLPFKTVDLYLAISLGTPRQTVEKLQKALLEMEKDKTLNTIYDKWVPGLTPPKVMQ